MTETATLTRTESPTAEHFDVLIVGAGISGVGAAYHLTKQCPGRSLVVLETQESFGGTWLTHRYPGIRSDSDLHTFGYRFKPWTSAPIAWQLGNPRLYAVRSHRPRTTSGSHIRYQHKIASAELVEPRGTLDDRGDPDGRPAKRCRFTTNFLVDVPGLLPATRRGHHAEVLDGMDELQGQHRSPTGTGRRIWTCRQERRRHRLWRHRRNAPIPAMAAGCRPHHDAAALFNIFQGGAQCDSTCRASCGRFGHRRRTWIHEIVRKKILYEQDVFTRRSPPNRTGEAVKQECCSARCEPSGGRLRRGHAFHADLPAMAATDRVYSGRRSVSGDRQSRKSLGGHR